MEQDVALTLLARETGPVTHPSCAGAQRMCQNPWGASSKEMCPGPPCATKPMNGVQSPAYFLTVIPASAQGQETEGSALQSWA